MVALAWEAWADAAARQDPRVATAGVVAARRRAAAGFRAWVGSADKLQCPGRSRLVLFAAPALETKVGQDPSQVPPSSS